MTKTKKYEPTPIQRLRQEKRRLKAMYTEDWEYLTDNIGYLAFSSIIKGAKSSFFPSLLKSKDEFSDKNKGGGHNILNALTLSMPLIWEIVQPMLVGYMIKKVKNLFSFKKKKE